MKKTIIVFSGAGVSAESGLKTFRDSDGLWEGYRVEDVATPQAWNRNPELVLEFYNERRRALARAKPNAAHQAIAALETAYQVHVITQNVDDLHERAGSTNVLHLHGELTKSQSTGDMSRVYALTGTELKLGDLCEAGYQLRPYIVWFGEAVPMMEPAIELTRQADIFLVVGTSLAVYPAASLLSHIRPSTRSILVDPKADELPVSSSIERHARTAAQGIPRVVESLLQRSP